MNVLELYLASAQSEEACEEDAAAILHYLAAFCHSVNGGDFGRAIPLSERIRQLQLRIGIDDQELIALTYSDGLGGTDECRSVLSKLISSNSIEIDDIGKGDET